MDASGFNWTLLTIVGPALLAVVVLWALLRNRGSRRDNARTEEATHRLYEQEEAERQAPDSNKGP